MSATYLVDTSAIIGMTERIEQRPSLAELIASTASDDAFVVSIITRGELAHAVAASGDLPESKRSARIRTRSVGDMWEAIPIGGDAIAGIYGDVSANADRRAGIGDRWIVATAKLRTLHLLTEDAGLHETAIRHGVTSTLMTSQPVPIAG